MSILRWRVFLTIICATVSTLIIADQQAPDAWAWRSPPPAYWSGSRIRELPRDHRRVWHGSDSFYFSYGRYYRRGPEGLFITVPPFGLIVPTLPFGYVSFVVGGATYYDLNGIYYTRVPEGYRVVEYPAAIERPPVSPAAVSGQRIIVQSDLLNVRSGPGLAQDVIVQVERGTVLSVLGSVPEWYYVELESGERGWVMMKFVAPAKPEPQG